MKSIYKWKIADNMYAYVMSEDSNEPFLYDGTNRIYEDRTVGTEPDDTAISLNVDTKTEMAYMTSFNKMKTLMANEGVYVSGLKDYTAYFNYEDSACYEEGNLGLCPKIIFKRTETLAPGSQAYTNLLGSYIEPDGTRVFEYELGIPSGEKGEQGSQGIQGPKGDSGTQGPQGETGEDGKDGEDGEDGVSPDARYVSTIFKRDNNLNPVTEKEKMDASQPFVTGDTNPYFNEPMSGVSDLGWSDSVPSADTEGNTNAIVWLSRKIFTTADDWGNYLWSEPVQASDSKDIDREWNVWEFDPEDESKVLGLEDMQAGGKYEPLRQSPDDENPNFKADHWGHVMTVEEWIANGHVDNHGWHDEPISGTVWLAEHRVKNGEYPEDTCWEVSCVKGEDGDNGEPLHVKEEWVWSEFPKHMDSSVNVINEAHVCIEDIEEPYEDPDGYYITGHIYVWDGDSWVDAGLFTGKASYVHIKYALETTGTSVDDENYIDYLGTWIKWTDESGETPNGDYIGLYTNNTKDDDELIYKNYKWAYSKGEDGFGYEYVYCAVREQMDIIVPTGGTKYAIGSGNTRVENWNTSSDSYQNNFDFIPKNVFQKDVGELTPTDDPLHPQPSENCINWQDNLITPTKEMAYVYEIYRRKNADGSWSGFIGANDGYAALCKTFTISPDFRSTIFKRGNMLDADEEHALLLAETESTYENPVPESLGWTDGIPEGNEIVWMSYRIFTLDKTKTGDKYKWSKPTLAEDSDNMEFEWNAEHPEWTSVESEGFHGPERTSPVDTVDTEKDRYGWCDNPVAGAIWMAQCNIKGGVYEQMDGTYNPEGTNPKWVYSRVKGEKGEKGEQGERGADGASSYNLDLSNENDTVGLAGGEGGDLVLDTTVESETDVFLYNGQLKVTLTPEMVSCVASDSHIGVDIQNLEGSEGVKVVFTFNAGMTFVPVAEGSVALEPKTVVITATLPNGVSFSKTYKLNGSRNGKDGTLYRLKPSVNSIPFDTSAVCKYDKVYTYAYFGKEDLFGKAEFKVVYSTGGTIHEDYDATSMPDCTGDTDNGYWYVLNEKFPYVSSREDAMLVLYLLRNTGGGNWNIEDWETLPYIKDGKDGVGTLTVDLSNEMDGMSLGDDNVLNAVVSSSTVASVMSGTTALTITSVTVDISDNMQGYLVNGQEESGLTMGKINYIIDMSDNDHPTINFVYYGTKNEGITFPEETGNRFELIITLGSDAGSFSRAMTVIGFKGGKDGSVFRLRPEVDYVRVTSDNRLSPTSVTCDIFMTNIEEFSAATLNNTFKLYYNVGQAQNSVAGLTPYADGRNSSNVPTYNGAVCTGVSADIKDIEKEIVFYYVSGGSLILDRESIPYVRNGKDGEGYCVADLDNEVESIGVGEDEILKDINVSAETNMSIYFGKTMVPQAAITFTSCTPYGVSSGQTDRDIVTSKTIVSSMTIENSGEIHVKIGLKGTDVRGVSFTKNDGDNRREFKLTATVNDGGVDYTVSKIFTIIGISDGKDGDTYKLKPSVKVIQGTYNSSGVLMKDPDNVKCSGYTNGNWFTGSSGNFKVTYTINEEPHLTSSGTQTYKSSGVSTSEVTKNITFYLCSGKTVLDIETVPLITNGKDGKGFCVGELNNDMEAVSVGSNGILEVDTQHKTTLSVYFGSDPAIISGVNIDAYDEKTETDMNNRLICTAKTISGNEAEVTFALSGKSKENINFNTYDRRQFLISASAQTDGSSETYVVSKVFTIVGVKSGEDGSIMRVVPSVDVLQSKFDADYIASSITPTSLTCSAYIGNTAVTNDKIWVTINCIPAANPSALGSVGSGYTAYCENNTTLIRIEGSSKHPDITDKITFYLVETSGATATPTAILDRETVPVIYDGEKGAQGPEGPAGETDLDKVFKVTETDGAILTNFIGVSSGETNPTEASLVAFMNGSNQIKVSSETVMLAAGCSTSLAKVSGKAATAKFRVLSSGKVQLTDGSGNTKVEISPVNVDIKDPFVNTATTAFNGSGIAYSSGQIGVYTGSGITIGTIGLNSGEKGILLDDSIKIRFSVTAGGSNRTVAGSYILRICKWDGTEVKRTTEPVHISLSPEMYDDTKYFTGLSETSLTETCYLVLSGSSAIENALSTGEWHINIDSVHYCKYKDMTGYTDNTLIGLNGMQCMYQDGSNLTIVKTGNDKKIQARVAGTQGKFYGLNIDKTGIKLIYNYKYYNFDPSTGTFK